MNLTDLPMRDMYTPQQLEMLRRKLRDIPNDPEKPHYALRPLEEFMLPMPDGVRLKTYLQRPDTEKPVPVVLMRSPYVFNTALYYLTAHRFAQYGIAVVWQYCRGIGASEGVWEPYIHERGDGKETAEWICAQDWVESVGFYGSSYTSFTGWIFADISPKKLKTMFLSHFGNSRYLSAYSGGLFHHDILTGWAMDNAGFPINSDYKESCLYRPQIRVDEDLWGRRVDFYRDYVGHQEGDDDFWTKGFWHDTAEIPARVTIPICLVEAWYDHHLDSALASWNALPETTRSKSRLVIGGWSHAFQPCIEDRLIEHLDADDETRAFNWFYHILVEQKIPESGVETYLIGADTWSVRDELRQKDANTLCLALSSDGTLKERGCGTVSYLYDPTDPFPSHGGGSLLYSRGKIGSLRQAEPGARDDTVSFLSEPLADVLDISGRIRFHLNVSSDADDTAFICRLMETKADGCSYNIRIGATALSFRNGSQSRLTYTPGEKVELVIDCADIAYRMEKGSRVRLDITSSDFPQFAVHTNYAGPWALQETCRTARQTIFCGESFLELPVTGRTKREDE